MLKGDFNSSVKIGDEGQEVIEKLMTMQGLNFIRTKDTKYTEMGLDFESDYYIKGENRFIEAKSLEGHCPTFCIEKYKNKENPYWNPKKRIYMGLDNQNDVKYPGWMRTVIAGENIQIYILNRKQKTVYIYNGNKMYDYIQNYPDGGLRYALDSNTHDSGLCAIIEWECKEAGFISKHII